MPAWVDSCVSSLLPELKRKNPKKSIDALKRMAWAICQDQYNRRKKKRSKESMSDDLTLKWDGKMAVFETLTEAMKGFDEGCNITMRGEAHNILESERPKTEFAEILHTGSAHTTVDGEEVLTETTDSTTVPTVTESVAETPHIFIRGTAIGEGVTRNLNEYLATELQQAAPTLADVPLQIDHGVRVSDNAGRVLVASFDPKSKSIEYIARLRRSKTDAFEAVQHGDIDSVSIGARVNDVLCNICGESKLRGGCEHVVGREYEGEIATRIGVGLEFFELSITPFGAYQGANVAGVISQNSMNLDDALASFTESWRNKFGEKPKMSEQTNDQAAEVELTEAQDKLKAAEESNTVLTERVKKTFARTVAEAEVEMGQRKQEDLNTRVESLKSKSVDALELLSEATSERLVIFRRDQHATTSRSQGIVSEDDEELEPTEVSAEELKTFLRKEWMGWPEPSESAKEAVRMNRRNTFHPNYNLYAQRERGGR